MKIYDFICYITKPFGWYWKGRPVLEFRLDYQREAYITLLITLLFIMVCSVPVLAVESLVTHYESYTYDFWGAPVPAPHAYLPSLMVTGVQMGTGVLANPQDIVVLENSTYILDTSNNRIVEVDENWQFIRSISEFQNGDIVDKFNEPQGLFVTEDGWIYVADTANERVVVLDQDVNLIDIILSPHEDANYSYMFEDRFVFRPRKIGVDRVGRIYIIAQDLYDGIMVMDIDGSFSGFVGAPKVNPSAIDLFWNMIASDEQRLRTQLYLPIEYSNINVDREGFIYAVVAGPAENEAIKRLNPSGADIIVRDKGFHPMRGDSAQEFHKDEENDTRSRFVDIAGRPNGVYSVLDRERGRIFTYDNQGNLLYVFGGIGDAIGLFMRPVALDTRGEQIIVLDADGRITIFEPTEYAQLIHAALDYYNDGNYEQSTAIWQKLTRINPNLDVAHSGIGRALFYDQEYEKAMESYKHGQNRSGYSQAFTKYRQEYANDNFAYIAWSIIAIILLLYFITKYKLWVRFKKAIGSRVKNSWGETAATAVYLGVPIKNQKTFKAFFLRTLESINYARYVIFHPFDGFWDLKHEKRGNVAAATFILIITVLAWVFNCQYEAFIFNERRVDYLNIFFEAANILLPFILWCIVNWALTTLMEGKGTFKDIYIATAFALVPIILIFVPITLFSHFLTQPEGAFISLAKTIALIWMIGLVFVGTMVTHEYSGVKTVVTSISTIAGIAIVLFIGLLFTSLINQVIGFFYKLYLELVFR